MKDIIHFKLGNYYGEVIAFEKEGKFYMGLDNYDGFSTIEISPTFYTQIIDEFCIEKFTKVNKMSISSKKLEGESQ